MVSEERAKESKVRYIAVVDSLLQLMNTHYEILVELGEASESISERTRTFHALNRAAETLARFTRVSK